MNIVRGCFLLSFRLPEGELSDSYQNRYPGFLAERLLTFWCFFYEKKYQVVYADKNFLK